MSFIDVLPEGLKLREIAAETDVQTVVERKDAELMLPGEPIRRF